MGTFFLILGTAVLSACIGYMLAAIMAAQKVDPDDE